MSTPLSPADEATRQQHRASDPRASVWVSASAGSGKTKVLTDRVLRLLLSGVAPDRILALTFTKAAAAEMANRINAKLAGWAVVPDTTLVEDISALDEPSDPDQITREKIDRARRLFAQVLDLPNGMRIQTIHAFCQSLLGRFPVEAGVAANFTVLDDREANRLLTEARDAVLVRAQRGGGSIGRQVEIVSRHCSEDDFTKLIGNLLSDRAALRDWLAHIGGTEQLLPTLRSWLDVPPGLTEEQLVLRFVQTQAHDDGRLRALTEALSNGGVNDQKLAAKLVPWLQRGEPDRARTVDDYLEIFLNQDMAPRSDRAVSKGTETNLPGSKALFLAHAEACVDLLTARNAIRLVAANCALFHLADEIIEAYRVRKAANARLDFDDLIETTRALLTQPGGSDWVAFKLDAAISHILVDESQDTNDPQWRIVAALTTEFFAGAGQELNASEPVPRSLFVVGDRKQSIYSFQGADPARFDAMRSQFADSAQRAEMRWEEVPLAVSFRSTSAVLGAVDASFAGPDLAPSLVGQGQDWQPHSANRAEALGTVHLHPVIDKAALGLDSAGEAHDLLATRIAEDIAAMIARGTAKAGDVMILLKNRKPLAERLLRSLQSHGVPVAGLDRIKLSEQLLYKDLLALTRFVLFPDDDLSLAEVLRGPLCGLDESALFALAADRGATTRLWSRLRDAAHRHPEATQFLTDALNLADYAPAFEFFTSVLDALGGRNKLIAHHGATSDDALNEFLGQVLAFETDTPPSLQHFERWAREAELEIKRDSEEGGVDAVRIMTVHASKGLQAPVVILPDTIHKASSRQKLFWEPQPQAPGISRCFWLPNKELSVDVSADLKAQAAIKDSEESARLAYVAMTRAEDALHIYGAQTVTTLPEDSWFAWIQRGMARAGAEDHQDHLILRSGSAPRVLKPGADPQTVPADQPPWLSTPPPEEERPARPLTPSVEAEADDEPVRPPATDGVPDFARFERGRLTHHLLQHLPALPPERWRTAATGYLTQAAPDATDAQRDSITSEVLTILQDPHFAPLFDEHSRAEVPLTAVLGSRVVSGRVDRLRLFPDRDEVWIIDYKTNRPPPTDVADLPRLYEVQMAAYAQTLKKIYPDKRARAFVLWTDGARLMELPASVLSQDL